MNVHSTFAGLVIIIGLFKNLNASDDGWNHGDYCTEDPTICKPTSKLACQDVPEAHKPGTKSPRKCLCIENRAPYPSLTHATDCRPPTSVYGGPCSSTQACARGLVCIKEKCSCSEGFSWSGKFCKLVPPVGEVCAPESIPNTCDKAKIGNYECNATAKVCQCPQNTGYAPEFMACKLKPGENCHFVLDNNQKVTEHDLCESQHCEASAKCACTEDGGRMIWSVEHNRCIENLFGNSCNEDADCMDPMLNAGDRVNLICSKEKPTRCKCPADRSFFKGYCVTATALYNATCDPTGKGTTCKTDGGTMLTCKQSGSDWKCTCLVKDVSARAKKKDAAIMLLWDSKSQICDLAPDGANCMANYECKSGVCTNNKCMSTSKSDGSRVTLQKFLAITVAFALIILQVVI